MRLKFLATGMFCIGAWLFAGGAAAQLESGKPIRVGTLKGRGPLALPVLQNWVRGSAFVFDSRQPDLFVKGQAGPATGLYVFPWLETTQEGVPVFGKPTRVKSPFTDRGTIFQTADGIIHGVWLDGRNLVHTTFDRAGLQFTETGRVLLEGLPRNPSNVAVILNPDGSIDVVLEISDGVVHRTSDVEPRSEEYRPYDGAGIWHGGQPYQSLYAVTLSGLLEGSVSHFRLVSRTVREIRMTMQQLTVVNLGVGRERDLVTGSRFGDFHYYHNGASEGIDFETRLHLVDVHGIALRHPSIAPAVTAYPNPTTGLSDLIAGGEGALYYYQFTGRFTGEGKPIYENPLPVLQEEADLYAGTLPVPTVVDWNGDGVLDIVSGNSEGRILFFENQGTDEMPIFLPGVPLKAGGREICIQPGYRLSIQGPQEARWGYACPTVVDWNEDGLPDILMSDSTARHTVFMNRGAPGRPWLEEGRPLYCDGLDMHGMWRVKPAVGKLGGRMAYVQLDSDGDFHLYWRLDDYNVEDGGKLRLEDGSTIGSAMGYSGGTGRLKLHLADWDGDGLLDFIVGTSRSNAVPNRQTGLPQPVLGTRPLAIVLLLRNVGRPEEPVFKHPVAIEYQGTIIEPGGAHACGPTITTLGGGEGPHLLVGNETGRFIFYRREFISYFDPLASNAQRSLPE